MPTRLDHVIVLGRDLARLEAAFTRLGFWVTGGGTHPHLLGTLAKINRLVRSMPSSGVLTRHIFH